MKLSSKLKKGTVTPCHPHAGPGEIVKKIEMEDTSATIHRKLNQKGFIVLKKKLVNELFAPSSCNCKICQEWSVFLLFHYHSFISSLSSIFQNWSSSVMKFVGWTVLRWFCLLTSFPKCFFTLAVQRWQSVALGCSWWHWVAHGNGSFPSH